MHISTPSARTLTGGGSDDGGGPQLLRGRRAQGHRSCPGLLLLLPLLLGS
jgi:hypothetical protein